MLLLHAAVRCAANGQRLGDRTGIARRRVAVAPTAAQHGAVDGIEDDGRSFVAAEAGVHWRRVATFAGVTDSKGAEAAIAELCNASADDDGDGGGGGGGGDDDASLGGSSGSGGGGDRSCGGGSSSTGDGRAHARPTARAILEAMAAWQGADPAAAANGLPRAEALVRDLLVMDAAPETPLHLAGWQAAASSPSSSSSDASKTGGAGADAAAAHAASAAHSLTPPDLSTAGLRRTRFFALVPLQQQLGEVLLRIRRADSTAMATEVERATARAWDAFCGSSGVGDGLREALRWQRERQAAHAAHAAAQVRRDLRRHGFVDAV